MSNLYDRCRVRLESSKNLLKKVSEDDAYLDSAAFDAQQSLEFMLKFIMSERNIQYPKTHSILLLYKYLSAAGFTFDDEGRLLVYADAITEWETESRYGQGVKTTVQFIKECHEITESLMAAYAFSCGNGKSSAISGLFKNASGDSANK